MDFLFKELVDARVKNFEQRWFIPHDALHRVMTVDLIRRALESTTIEPQDYEEISKSIFTGARNVFAILVLMKEASAIKKFIEEDKLQRLGIDSRLPFHHQELELILDSTESKIFLERQWEVAVPVFSGQILSRTLPKNIILPIVDNEEIGSGSFGVVYKIKIVDSHQLFFGGPYQLVRKQFTPLSGNNSFEKELHNLSILRLLKHPNIAEALGSYVLDGKQNLLFKWAPGGSLEDLFKSSLPENFGSVVDVVVAITGLCSAVAAVHDFFSKEMQLRAMGFHHDLKPGNVLVEGSTFILADFGLSRIDVNRQSSGTSFKNVRGTHVAPECEDLDGSRTSTTNKPVIRRSSDIWSLGCIIAEVLTFTLRGSVGLAEFEENRRYRVGNVTYFRFHNGKEKESPAINQWFSEMQNSLEKPILPVLGLLRRILQLEPDKRPKAKEVARQMECTALRALCQRIEDEYKVLWKRNSDIRLFVEHRRFLGWFWSWNSSDLENGRDSPDNHVDKVVFDFITVTEILCEKREVLTGMNQRGSDKLEAEYQMITRLNDKLLDSASVELRQKINPYLISSLLRSNDQEILDKLASIDSPSRQLAEIRASLKRMHEKMNDRSKPVRPDLRLDSSHVRDAKLLGDFTVGRLTNDQNQTFFSVLIERKSFPKDGISSSNIVELMVRLESITQLLETAAKSNGLCMLNCCGYCLDTDRRERGLVYKFPDRCSKYREASVITLNIIIRESRSSRSLEGYATLGDRFRLARTLAKTLLEFHLAGWLRESISSHNIAFFFRHGSSWLEDEETKNPYFLGFVNSREATPSAFTEGPDQGIHGNYQTPEYQTGTNVRFKPVFDYYSLGIVLLEIGRWKVLQDMSRAYSGHPSELRKGLRDKEVQQLGISMGTIYRDVVDKCLSGELESSVQDDDVTIMNFSKQIVEELGNCSA